MHIHASNYRVRGFTESVGIGELVGARAASTGLKVIDDIGSGR